MSVGKNMHMVHVYVLHRMTWYGSKVDHFLMPGCPEVENSYSASSLVLPLFGILTFIGISSCRRGCVWGTKFRFSVFVCLSLMFLET